MENPAPPAGGGDLERRVAALVFLAAVAAAVFLRFHALDAKPLHSDEGVNGFFLETLRDTGRFRYDPANYHGPLFFYLGLLPILLGGLTPSALRCLPAAAGVGCVLLLWPLRRQLGAAGLGVAAWVLAVDPVLVFFSRTAIHETYLVFFTLAAVVALARYPAAAARGRPAAAVLPGVGVACLALLYATKETAVFSYAALAAGLAASRLAAGGGGLGRRLRATRDRMWEEWREPRCRRRWLGGLAAAAMLVALLFTSLGMDLRGLGDLVEGIVSWVGRGLGHERTGHEKALAYYGELLSTMSAPAAVLGLGGVAVAALRRRPFPLFVAGWTVAIALLYSLVPYKTPWLATNLLLPAALAAGLLSTAAVRGLAAARPRVRAALALVGLLVPFLPSPAGPVLGAGPVGAPRVVPWWRLGWNLNFRAYDDPRYPVVYVQTTSDVFALARRLRALLVSDPSVRAEVVSREYWPLPTYLADQGGRFLYYGGRMPAKPGPILLIDAERGEQEGALTAGGGEWHRELFALRPDVILDLAVEAERWARVFGREPAVPVPAEPAAVSALEPGLEVDLFYGASCTGRRLAEQAVPRPAFAVARGLPRPVCGRWSGWLRIDEAGEYRFSTTSDDGSRLELGGAVVVDNAGVHPLARRSSRSVTLSPGLYRLLLQAFDVGGAAALEVDWRPPGDERERPIPPDRYLRPVAGP